MYLNPTPAGGEASKWRESPAWDFFQVAFGRFHEIRELDENAGSVSRRSLPCHAERVRVSIVGESINFPSLRRASYPAVRVLQASIVPLSASEGQSGWVLGAIHQGNFGSDL